MASNASVLIIERRPAVVSSITSVLAHIPEVTLLGSIPQASERDRLQLDAHPAIVVCGTGVLLPQTLTQFLELRAVWPSARLIALSFDPTEETRELTLSAGAHRYVSGINMPAELPGAIQAALDPDSTRQL